MNIFDILDNSILILLFILIAVLLLHKLFFRPFNRHRFNKKKAKQIIKKIQKFDHPGKIFSYLRKIDPFVFEELLLTTFENNGYRVIRNKRYTGDGGIDGRLVDESGELILLQAKRYSSHINKDHVTQFSRVVMNDRKAKKGYFVHTGKTGRKSYAEFKAAPNIELVSGENLIKLICYENR